jgi:hypothetical protein
MDLEIEDKEQYLKYLLDWCNDIYSHWEMVKPRFSKQFDLRSLEEWEELCQELKENLQGVRKENFDHYQRAKDLHDQWEILYKESYAVQKEVE